MSAPATMKKQDTVWFSYSDKPQVVSKGNASYIYREMNEERRSEQRLLVEDGFYAVIDSYSPQICSILNMGSHGLAYVYFKGDDPLFESTTMDVLVIGHGICLKNIGFKKVSDYQVDDGDKTSRFKKHVACIEFVDLDNSQKDLVESFINRYIKKTVN